MAESVRPAPLCPLCATRSLRPHPHAGVYLCRECGSWANAMGQPIPPPNPDDVRVPARVRAILRKLRVNS